MSDNEKRKKSRRSSILKPPKPRNPLSDVELNPPSETTIMKSRRVSFANVRFKEFTADPEKNTIWHTSYVEEMNKSDKSEQNEQHCSNEPDVNMTDKDMSLDADIMNCTQMHLLDISVENALANNSDSSISSAVIDLTKSSQNPKLVNMKHLQQSGHIADNLISFETIPDCTKRQTIHFQQEDLEFTETVTVNFNTNKPSRQTINFKTHPQNADMEMTHVVASDSNYNNEFEGATMEITKSIPSHIRNQNKALFAQKRQTINFKDTDIDQTIHFRETENNDLDFTEYVSSNVVVNKKRQTINFKHDEPEDDMDFTMNMNENHQNATKRQTILFSRASQDSNMDITEVIPTELLVTTQAVCEDKENILPQKVHQKSIKNRQTINFNQTSQTANMEMTETIPTEMLVIAQDKQYELPQKVHHKPTKNRQTINFNQTSQDANMEMTEIIPTELLVTAQAVCEDKENILPQKVHQKPTKNRQTINFNQTSQDANMEMTEIIPTEMLVTAQAVREDKENIFTQLVRQKSKTKRQTINFNQTSQDANMEMTEVVPAEMILALACRKALPLEDKENIPFDPAYFDKAAKHTSLLFNQTETANMDLTENIAIQEQINPQNVCEEENVLSNFSRKKPNRQTIHFNNPDAGNMELTENIPAYLSQNAKKQNRQTILFNNTSNDLEITENIPVQVLQNVEIAKQNRRTIHFNTEDAGNMEITQNIPTNLAETKKNQKHNRQTIHFNTEDTGNMEFTQNIPANLAETMKHQKYTRQTLHFNAENTGIMEITQNIPANLTETKKNQKHNRQTIHFNAEDTGIMELTQNMPTNLAETMKHQKQSRQTIHFNAEDTGNMEFTENIPANLAETKKNQKHNRYTIHFNAEDTGNMEITQNIPANLAETMKHQKHNRQTIHFDTEDAGIMELTQNMPTNLAETMKHQKQSRQTIHFNVEDTGNMEMTENIPICVQNKNRQTIHFNNSGNMDFTENIPTNFAQNTEKKQNRQTIHFNSQDCGTMELTENMSTNLVQNIIKEKLNSQESSNLEVTANISLNLVQTITKANQNRQTIHFNNPDAGNMDLTENIPANLAQNAPQTKIRQTIHFNQSENLDMTENIPNVIQDIKETEKSSRETININISEHATCNNQTRIGNMSVTDEFGTNFAVESKKVNYFNNPLCEKTENTENIQELLMEEALHFDTVGNTSKVQKIPKFSHSETGNFASLQNNTSISINFAQNTEKSLNILDTFNLTKYLEPAQPETTHPEVETDPNQSAVEDPNSRFKIFRFAGQPLILDPNSEQQNSSDICQRIKLPGQKDDFSVSKINLTDKLDFTPIQNSFNLTDNLNSIVDSTEKLINCKIDLPVSESEYSKIISDEIDKNYSIFNTSFPEHLEISSATETSEDGRNNYSCLEESRNKVESIISINSSIESVDKMDDIEKLYDQITLPLEIDFNFNIEAQLAKITYDDSEFEEITMLKNIEKERGNIQAKIKLSLNFNENDFQEDLMFSLPKYNCNENIDDIEHDKIFYQFQEFVNRKIKKQESKGEPKPLTLLDKIKNMHNNNTLWDLIPDSEYSFTYMDETIKFDVQMEPNSEIVKQVKFYPQLEESEYKSIGHYNYKIQMPKLTEQKIKSAVGERYTIFSLLDYVSKVGDETMDILKEFQHIFFNIGMKLDEYSNATLIFTDVFLRLAFEVTFNLNDLHNIHPDMIKVKNKASTADENALRRLVKLCPPGVQFIRKYNQLVNDYLQFISKAEQQKSTKNV